MTVPVQVPISASTANGVTTVFPYGFKVIQEEDLEVTVDGVVVTTGFTVSGVGSDSGGNVTFTTAPANGAKVVRALVPVLERTTDYQQFGDWLADVVNPDFDRIWLALQALSQATSRALKLPKDTADDQVTPTGATADERADKLIGFDASGDPVLLAQSDLEYAVEAAASAADAASSASDAADSAAAIASGSQEVTNLVCTGGTIDGTAIGGTTRAAVKGTSGSFNAGVTSSSSSDLVGYATGAGQSVTQSTSKSTGVTINKPCGKITTHDASLAADAVVGFIVTNSVVRATDTIAVNVKDGNGYKYRVGAYGINNGSFGIFIKNDTAGALAEALPLNFAILAAVES